MMKWVRLHLYNISQKVQTIVEHFRENVMWRHWHGKGNDCHRFKAGSCQIQDCDGTLHQGKELQCIGVLVAFPGDVDDPESDPDQFN